MNPSTPKKTLNPWIILATLLLVSSAPLVWQISNELSKVKDDGARAVAIAERDLVEHRRFRALQSRVVHVGAPTAQKVTGLMAGSVGRANLYSAGNSNYGPGFVVYRVSNLQKSCPIIAGSGEIGGTECTAQMTLPADMRHGWNITEQGQVRVPKGATPGLYRIGLWKGPQEEPTPGSLGEQAYFIYQVEVAATHTKNS
ncbi:hypothetical protein EON80_25770 [bacterium]|nr:MAG: hypothetical protein EON80_25770 [bacterium]